MSVAYFSYELLDSSWKLKSPLYSLAPTAPASVKYLFIFLHLYRVDEMGIDTIYSGVCTDDVNAVIPPVPVYCDCNLGSAPVCGADLDISSCTKPDKKSRKKKKGLVGEDVTGVMIQQATSPPSHCLSRAALVLFEFNATYISRVLLSHCSLLLQFFHTHKKNELNDELRSC